MARPTVSSLASEKPSTRKFGLLGLLCTHVFFGLGGAVAEASIVTSATPLSERPHSLRLDEEVADQPRRTKRTNQRSFEKESTALRGQLIVVLKDSVDDVSTKAETMLSPHHSTTWAPQVTYTYNHTLKGFAVKGVTAAVLDRLLNDSHVEYVAQDTAVWLAAAEFNPLSWGLDRIDQPSLPLDQVYRYDYTGVNVTAFILDSGILTTHQEFLLPDNVTSRASCGTNFVSTEPCDDLNGHGTHVAGIVGGNTVGVAKDVKLIAVKIMDQNGFSSSSALIAALEWVMEQKLASPTEAMVANLSVLTSQNSAVDTAVDALVQAGVLATVAAGNEISDACEFSPASSVSALTVGSTDIDDKLATDSNFGTCLDMLAPGVNITSSFNTSDDALMASSGTSMATAHITGVAAMILQQNYSQTPEEVRSVLLSLAVVNQTDVVETNSSNMLVQVPMVATIVPSSQTQSNQPASSSSSLSPGSKKPSDSSGKSKPPKSDATKSQPPKSTVNKSKPPKSEVSKSQPPKNHGNKSQPPKVDKTSPDKVSKTDAPKAPKPPKATNPPKQPAMTPTTLPSASANASPSSNPLDSLSASPAASPSASPAALPSASPAASPSASPAALPSASPAALPSVSPAASPSASPAASPSASPAASPSASPAASSSASPVALLSASPASSPSAAPVAIPSASPAASASAAPAAISSASPSALPSASPLASPSTPPFTLPTASPAASQSASPSQSNSSRPTAAPLMNETPIPTTATQSSEPSTLPSSTFRPTVHPTVRSTTKPSQSLATVRPSLGLSFTPSESWLPTISPVPIAAPGTPQCPVTRPAYFCNNSTDFWVHQNFKLVNQTKVCHRQCVPNDQVYFWLTQRWRCGPCRKTIPVVPYP